MATQGFKCSCITSDYAGYRYIYKPYICSNHFLILVTITNHFLLEVRKSITLFDLEVEFTYTSGQNSCYISGSFLGKNQLKV